MAKLIGWILALIGIAGLAIAMVPEIAEIANLPESISGTPLLVTSIIIALVGVLLIAKGGGGGKQAKEVPIYKGKNIVGYRQPR